MEWNVKYKNRKKIEKTVFAMRSNAKRAFVRAIRDLESQGPRPKEFLVKELKGQKDLYALRLDYRHRMIYSVFKKNLMIEIIEVSTREKAYQ